MFFVAATLEAPAFDIILRTQILPEKKRIATIAPFTTRRYQKILRMPGLGFVLLYAYNVLPGMFALLAGLGDAMAAVDATFISIKLLCGSEVSKQSLPRWNSYGLIDFLIAITVDTLLRSSLLGGTTKHRPVVIPAAQPDTDAGCTVLYHHASDYFPAIAHAMRSYNNRNSCRSGPCPRFFQTPEPQTIAVLQTDPERSTSSRL